jgi:putative ABC transport system permease protein
MSLKQFSWRSMWRRPGRTILTVLSIVIGVAAVVSVSITTATTRNAYKQMAAMVAGKADLVVEGEGEVSFPSSLLSEIQAVPGVQAAVPVFGALGVLHAHGERIRLQLLGVDVEHDSAVREYTINEGRPLQGGKELLLDETFARRLKVQVGDEVKLTMRAGLKSIKVVGFLQLRGASALQHAGLVLMPIDTAQSWCRAKGKLSSIQIVADPQVDADQVRERISSVLPTGLRVHPPAVRTQGMQEMLFSSEKGLQLTTAGMLLLAAFIILNTFMMNVSERRRQFSILRAVGATGDQVMLAVLREALLLGIVGTLIGIGMGLIAAFLLNRSLSNLLEVPLPAMELSPLPFVLAALFGIGISLIGAFMPARNARRISPLEGMDRVSKEDLSGVPTVYIELGGIVTLASGTLIVLSIRGFVPMDIAIVAGVFLFLGLVFLSPVVLTPLCRAVVWLLRPVSRVESGLALRQVLRHHARSTLTVGVLFVAGAMGVGIACSILDNVRDVKVWYRKAIIGDFYVRAMLPDMATTRSASMPDELGPALRQVAGITMLEGMSWIQAQVGENTVLVAAREMVRPPSFDLVEGDSRRIRQQMIDGQVVIGSVLAQRMAKGVGDVLELETQDTGKAQFPICGVANDYLSGGLTLYIHRDVAVKRLGVEGYTVYVIQAGAAELDQVRQRLQAVCDEYGVLLHSNAEITGVIDRMIIGIDGCLWGLLVLVFVVASFGVVNTLTMNVLEQTREFGVLRIVAMTKRQLRRTILTQALIMGGVGFAPGVLGGIGFAYVINLALPAALGHPVEFGFHPWLALGTLASALVVTVAAAWLPAQRAANLDVGSALHYE